MDFGHALVFSGISWHTVPAAARTQIKLNLMLLVLGFSHSSDKQSSYFVRPHKLTDFCNNQYINFQSVRSSKWQQPLKRFTISNTFLPHTKIETTTVTSSTTSELQMLLLQGHSNSYELYLWTLRSGSPEETTCLFIFCKRINLITKTVHLLGKTRKTYFLHNEGGLYLTFVLVCCYCFVS